MSVSENQVQYRDDLQLLALLEIPLFVGPVMHLAFNALFGFGEW